ncbi:hypothetical protein BD779DRAFT_1551569 [Infundibulicybe gibba]|nr:hypothetical protein BD779DRAFT_1551569 [Infundibulicybe gibba]
MKRIDSLCENFQKTSCLYEGTTTGQPTPSNASISIPSLNRIRKTVERPAFDVGDEQRASVNGSTPAAVNIEHMPISKMRPTTGNSTTWSNQSGLPNHQNKS